MNPVIRARECRAPTELPIEVVERKGLGHPDTICDAVAERISTHLCRYYLAHFGQILHHNVDKVLLCGGSARPMFGGGEVTEPIELYLAGRATDDVRGERVPVADIALEACREWLRHSLPELDLQRHVRIIPRLRPGSRDLAELFLRGADVPLANDTSCGVGFAPLTDLEKVVLATERLLNDATVKQQYPAIGRDIKVMGIRKQNRIELTIGCAIVGRHVSDIDAYAGAKENVRTLALTAARASTGVDVEAVVNAGDDLARGAIFLTVTGTSAEAGDDGEVGRGNRSNGLITPYRPMTMEAAAGKNPVNHVGKLYNVVAGQIAKALAERLARVRDATCLLVSRIGQSIAEPQVADIQLGLGASSDIQPLVEPAAEIVRAELGKIAETRRALLEGRVGVF
jgi:S-adenosylmethionine synthetase